MDVQAAKYIGSGLAVICLFGVGIGIGNIFSAFITSVARNPAARPIVFPFTLIAFLILFG